MKLALAFLALVAVAASKSLNLEDALEDNTAYGYLTKIGLPLANKIREAESSQSRIVGGSFASLGQFPYQAGLVINFTQGQAVCGGVLVGAQRVLTAAHCWYDGRNQALLFTVVLGSITLFSGGERIETSDVIMHRLWLPSVTRNDIAMINLPSVVSFGSNIAPIKLPSGGELNDDFVGEMATASGFGRTSDNVGTSTGQVMSWVNLRVISNTVCRISFPIHVSDGNVCTSGANGQGTCGGDSGGPLVVQRNGNPVLIGLTSFGSARGCEVGSPAAYVRVTEFISWIQQRL